MPVDPDGRLLLSVLRRTEALAPLSLAQWDRLLRLARSTGVLHSLAVRAEAQGLTGRFPAEVQPHLAAARQMALRHDRAVRWEITRIERALAGVDTPLVLLKGTAYLAADLDAARGRVSADVDLLVGRDALGPVEQALRRHGWAVDEENPHHEAYFRRWLHELPPLRHRERLTVLDVHHTILPRTDRLRLEPQLLLDASRPLAGRRMRVLAPADMALHSAAHLFRNGDFSSSLRDLWDLDRLLRQLAEDAGFWEALVGRAVELDLALPCYCALRYARRLFGTPVPPPVRARIRAWRPFWLDPRLLDVLVLRTLWPRHLDGPDRVRSLAIGILAHWPLPRPRAMASAVFWLKRLPLPRVLRRDAP
jgi:hypothetical protein